MIIGFILSACEIKNQSSVFFRIRFSLCAKTFWNHVTCNDRIAQSLVQFCNFFVDYRVFLCRFLHAHSCEVHLTPKIQDESMARWRHIVLRCRDLAYNDISSVICHKSCFDPVSCERVDHLKGVPVLWGRAIIDSQRKKHRIDLPVACKCIAKTKKPEAQC